MMSSVGCARRAAMTSRVCSSRYGKSTSTACRYSSLPRLATSVAWNADAYRFHSSTSSPSQSTVTIAGTPITSAMSHWPSSMIWSMNQVT